MNVTSLSQDVEYESLWGGDIRIGKSALFVSSSFTEIPGNIGCCPEFTLAEGNSSNFGFDVFYNLSNDIRLRSGFDVQSGSFTFSENKDEVISVNGELYDGVFAHIVNIDQASMSINMNLDLRAYNELWFNLGLGYFTPFETLFEQYEQIVKPEDRGVFVDTGTRQRNRFSGDISNQLTGSILLDFGLFYRMPLDNTKSLFLVPSIGGKYAVSSMFSDLDWKHNSIDFSIGLEYNFNETKIFEQKEEKKYIPEDAILISAIPIVNGKEAVDFVPIIERKLHHHILVQPASATVDQKSFNSRINYSLRNTETFQYLGTEILSTSNFEAFKLFFLKQHDFKYDNWTLNVNSGNETKILEAGSYFDLNETILSVEELNDLIEFENLSISLAFSSEGEQVFRTEQLLSMGSFVKEYEVYHFDIYNIEKLKLIDSDKYNERVEVLVSEKVLSSKTRSLITNILSSKGFISYYLDSNVFDNPIDPDSISIIIKFSVK